eukprot:scaffold1639_cov331-Pavlova_lutheri.AAC.1
MRFDRVVSRRTARTAFGFRPSYSLSVDGPRPSPLPEGTVPSLAHPAEESHPSFPYHPLSGGVRFLCGHRRMFDPCLSLSFVRTRTSRTMAYPRGVVPLLDSPPPGLPVGDPPCPWVRGREGGRGEPSRRRAQRRRGNRTTGAFATGGCESRCARDDDACVDGWNAKGKGRAGSTRPEPRGGEMGGEREGMDK